MGFISHFLSDPGSLVELDPALNRIHFEVRAVTINH
jgi:hypothetical protein